MLETPGVRIYCDEAHAAIAELARERVPVLRDTIARDMGIDPSGGDLHEVVVKIYPRMRELQALRSIPPTPRASRDGTNPASRSKSSVATRWNRTSSIRCSHTS
ncbi:MAG: hypothetical protein R3B67_06495 [Phycisphaerales bacterium]